MHPLIHLTDNEPPQFGNSCPQNTHVFADSGKTSKVVTWPPVVATDNSGEKPRMVKTGVHSVYLEGKHYVTYEATDTAGNKGFCTFTITVRGTLIVLNYISHRLLCW